MGNEEFVQGVLDRLDQRIGAAPTLEKIVRTVCQVYGLKETELRGSGQRRVPSEVRAVVGWLAMEYGSATLSEVGRRFNRDVTTMSSAVRRLIGRARDLKVLRDRMGGLKSEVV